MKKLNYFSIGLLFLVSVLNIQAQKVEFTGYGAAGYNIYDRLYLNEPNQEAYYEGKLQADIKLNKKIEAQLDLRGKSSDNAVNFREFSIKFEFFEHMNLKVGNIKKPFGYEQLINREKLIPIERSYVQNKLQELGFGGRNISIMAYNNYSKKDEDTFPYSYNIALHKDNSSGFGATARFRLHDDNYSYGASYMFQKYGGTPSIMVHGGALDFVIDKKRYTNNIELFFVNDPVEGLRRKLINEDSDASLDEKVYTAGAKILTAYKFKTKYDFLEAVQPMLMLSYFLPNIDVKDSHVIQALAGVNLYIDDDVAFRFNLDLRLTKNEFNDSYTTKESRAMMEIQATF